MNSWPTIIAILTALGAVAAGFGLHRLWTVRSERKKNNADAGKATAEATVALATAEDDHLDTLVNSIIKPLREELDRVRVEVAELRADVQTVSRRYRVLAEWARQVLAWQRSFHKDIDPPMPTLPPEIAEDL